MTERVIRLSDLHDDQFIDYVVVSLFLDLSERTVQDMAARRELPVYKFGRKNRFKVKEIKQWAEQRRCLSGPKM